MPIIANSSASARGVQFKTIIKARVPRIDCKQDGVTDMQIPWAEPKSGFRLCAPLALGASRSCFFAFGTTATMALSADGQMQPVSPHISQVFALARKLVAEGD